MTNSALLSEINQLPESLKQEALHYISFLNKEYSGRNSENKTSRRVFGLSKGKYKLLPDFDEPIDDFKDYM